MEIGHFSYILKLLFIVIFLKVKNPNALLLAVILFSLPLFGQFRVPSEKELLSNPLKEEAMERLRNSQTVFFYRKGDDLIEMRKALEEVWTISELLFIPYAEAGKMDLRGKSFFVIEGLRTISKQYTTVDNSYVFLHLYMDLTDKKGKEFQQTFARLDLFPSEDAMKEMSFKDKGEIFDLLYGTVEINNWTPGFLRNYLKNINDLLESGEGKGLYEGKEEVPSISGMTSKPLYVPDYVLTKKSKMYGLVSGTHDPDKLMKNYPYAYTFKSASEISDAIAAGEDFYYLVFTRSSSDKYFTVYHSTSGEIVYNRYKPLSYNLKNSDLKDIADSVKKMKKKAERSKS